MARCVAAAELGCTIEEKRRPNRPGKKRADWEKLTQSLAITN